MRPAQAAAPPAAVPATALAAAWHVRLPDGREVGPLTQAALDQAVQQGQITAQCQIWTPGWPQPRWASELYPALAAPASPLDGGFGYPGMTPSL